LFLLEQRKKESKAALLCHTEEDPNSLEQNRKSGILCHTNPEKP